MSPDDPGVMGNLPRSRPGRRSSKREGTGGGAAAKPAPAKATAAKATAAKATAAKSTAKKTTARRPAKRTSTSGAKSTSSSRSRARAPQKPAARPTPPPPPPQSGGTDPVTGAVMLAGKVVEGGLKVAGGIIKRLPRP